MINLVENGIFPITKDVLGQNIPGKLDTGLLVPGTIQGEGKLLGTSCLFLRTSGCNLRCAWVGLDGNGSPCDTPYSSHQAETNKMSADKIFDIIKHNIGGMSHIVISGGEPMMQAKQLTPLVKRLRLELNLHITVETNGTLFNEEFAEWVQLFSISPKLASSTPWIPNLKNTGIEFNEKWALRHERLRKNVETIQQIIDYTSNFKDKDFQLKFVVSTIDDISEIVNEFRNKLNNIYPSDIVLMPEGVTSDFLRMKSGWVIEEAIKRGWRFTPRLHIDLFGKARAV